MDSGSKYQPLIEDGQTNAPVEVTEPAPSEPIVDGWTVTFMTSFLLLVIVGSLLSFTTLDGPTIFGLTSIGIFMGGIAYYTSMKIMHEEKNPKSFSLAVTNAGNEDSATQLRLATLIVAAPALNIIGFLLFMVALDNISFEESYATLFLLFLAANVLFVNLIISTITKRAFTLSKETVFICAGVLAIGCSGVLGTSPVDGVAMDNSALVALFSTWFGSICFAVQTYLTSELLAHHDVNADAFNIIFLVIRGGAGIYSGLAMKYFLMEEFVIPFDVLGFYLCVLAGVVLSYAFVKIHELLHVYEAECYNETFQVTNASWVLFVFALAGEFVAWRSYGNTFGMALLCFGFFLRAGYEPLASVQAATENAYAKAKEALAARKVEQDSKFKQDSHFIHHNLLSA